MESADWQDEDMSGGSETSVVPEPRYSLQENLSKTMAPPQPLMQRGREVARQLPGQVCTNSANSESQVLLILQPLPPQHHRHQRT